MPILFNDEPVVNPENRPALLGQIVMYARALGPVAIDVSPTDERADPFVGAEETESLVH